MTQQGTHTWDIVHQYHRCPKCGYIMESRDKYQYRHEKYLKDLACTRCHQAYKVIKNTKPRLGPVTGDLEPVEIDWR